MNDVNYRDYALELVEQGFDAEHILLCALKYMSNEEVGEMLKMNELMNEDEECV